MGMREMFFDISTNTHERKVCVFAKMMIENFVAQPFG